MKTIAAESVYDMYDCILIAVDGSDEARRAARRGLHIANAFDATVTVLSVVERKALPLAETSTEKARLRERGERALTVGRISGDNLSGASLRPYSGRWTSRSSW